MTYNELKERAIEQVLFQCFDKFGIRRMDGDAAYSGFIYGYKRLFGDEEWSEICKELHKRADERGLVIE